MRSSHIVNKGSTDPEKKEEIREEMRAVLDCLSKKEHRDFSAEAQEWLFYSRFWKRSDVFYLFMSVRDEIDTIKLIQTVWDQGKKLYLPKCRKNEYGMVDFIRCRSFDELECQTYGILEPKAEPSESPEEPDLILVPGVAFTKDGLRLGNGAGYYDRFNASAQTKNAVRIGFSFSFQLLDALPEESWDIPMHFLCSNMGIFSTGVELPQKWS